MANSQTRSVSGWLAGREDSRTQKSKKQFSLKTLFVLTTCVAAMFASPIVFPIALLLVVFFSIRLAALATSDMLDWAARRSAFSRIPVAGWVVLSISIGLLILFTPLIIGLCIGLGGRLKSMVWL